MKHLNLTPMSKVVPVKYDISHIAASTCEEEGRMGIPYGEARALLGGGQTF